MQGKPLLTVIVFVVAVLLVPPASAQVFYGSIVGAVTDPSGAAVPNASVNITNTNTGQSRDVKTDSGGRYTITDVQAGNYDVKIAATGFRPIDRTGVAVSINTVTRVDAALEVGQVTE